MLRKREGGVDALACVIIERDGSVARMLLNEGESSRDIRP